MFATWRAHWPEYVLDGALLGLFMLSASTFGVLLFHPDSFARGWIESEFARRAWMGLAMGLTAVALVYSPLGQRSGAHMNPAVTLAFTALGRVHPRDAVGYVVAQFVGGALGMGLAARLLGSWIAHPAVDFVVTRPGEHGLALAFAGEAAISFVLLSVVLRVSASRFARFTGLCAGALVMLWITVEAPLSGMSMNTARTFASALAAQQWTAWWLYATAPLLGMLAAAALFARSGRGGCAKLHHENRYRCIFCSAEAR